MRFISLPDLWQHMYRCAILQADECLDYLACGHDHDVREGFREAANYLWLASERAQAGNSRRAAAALHLPTPEVAMNPALRIALCLVVPIAVAAAEPVVPEVQLDGMYLSTGINPDGGEFHGFVQIERHGDSFRVTWLMAQVQDDESVVLVPTGMGTGIVHGGMLAVSFHDSGLDGIGLFNIEDEGRWLAGRWALVGGDGATYIELLQRLPADVTPPVGSESPDSQPPLPLNRLLRPSGHSSL